MFKWFIFLIICLFIKCRLDVLHLFHLIQSIVISQLLSVYLCVCVCVHLCVYVRVCVCEWDTEHGAVICSEF